MFSSIKAWKLGAALKARGNATEAYSAVKELGRMGGPKAVTLLVSALDRKDGVARSAAREVGRLGGPEAAEALARHLPTVELHKAVLEALSVMGAEAVPKLTGLLKDPSPNLRCAVAEALGKIRHADATEPLIQVLTHDDAYAVRVAAAQALGEIQDQRAIWVLVATLKMRDESTAEQQQALAVLQEAARIALHKLGDPLGEKAAGGSGTLEEQVARMESELKEVADHHPKLAGELRRLGERDLVEVMHDLVSASEEISWAKVESRTPLLAPYFDTYEKRRETAEQVGRELLRRGGRKLLDEVLHKELNQYAAVANWWSHF